MLVFLVGAIILGHQEFALSFVVILVGVWAIIAGIAELAIAFEMPPMSGMGTSSSSPSTPRARSTGSRKRQWRLEPVPFWRSEGGFGRPLLMSG
jgi:hypothetical protein